MVKLISFLDELGWTQTRLSQESRVSSSTIRRILMGEDIQRQIAEDICKTLTRALGRTIRLQDVDEIHLQSAERPERRKYPRGEQ
jgi:predicted transcriptional regulator